jgi:hypothetical protein
MARRLSGVLALLLTIALLPACSDTEGRIAAMTVTTPPATNQGVAVTGAPAVPAPPNLYREAIGLGAVTGEPPSALYPVVSTDMLREILKRSLTASGLLAPGGGPGRFELRADLDPIKRPLLAATVQLRANTRFRLVEVATGREMLSVQFDETGAATVGEYFVGAQRLAVAEARAIRQSVERLLAVLYGRPQV